MSADATHLPAPQPAPALDHAPSPLPSPPGPARTHEQLAHLLAKAYSDIDALNRDLAQTRRRADKAERVAQSLTAVAETSGTNGTSQAVPEHITRVIHELEDRLTHAELAREDAEARRRFVMDQWFQVETHLNALDVRVQETRHSFTRVLRDGVPVSIPSANPFPASLPLPLHPGPNLRRPRTPSMEGSYPPSKRSRGNDGRGREPRVAYSEANMHGVMDASFARQHGAVRVIQQAGDKYPTNRPRSSSRSSTSSIDVDEMLLQASTGDENPGPNGAVTTAGPHGVTITMPLQAQGSQQVQSSHRSRRRHGEMVPPIRMSDAELHQYHRRPGHIDTSPYPASQSVPRKPQEHLQPGAQMQTYQTHIFAPPVTGAPIKKSKFSSMTVSSANLAPHGSSAVIDAPPQPGIAPAPLVPNFPPVNAQGQRICRQCGQAGRYKEGKCVEKWGPGPAGPGTVCDRCRKKMKRVERRGTLESQQQLAAAHLAAASGGPAQQHQPHITGDRSLQRSDTLPSHSTGSPASREKVSSHSNGNAAASQKSHIRTIIYPPASTGKESRSSPHSHRPISLLDEAPTSNVGRGSRNTSRTREPAVVNGHSRSPGEKMLVDATDSDADAEAEAEGEFESVAGGVGGRAEEEEEGEEGDAEADGDAEAELLEAVDAAEANSNAGSSHTG